MQKNIRNTPSPQVTARSSYPGSRSVARLHAVAAAVLLCTGLGVTGEAQALALGRIQVQSALGEPLRAEIDVPEITAEEPPACGSVWRPRMFSVPPAWRSTRP